MLHSSVYCMYIHVAQQRALYVAIIVLLCVLMLTTDDSRLPRQASGKVDVVPLHATQALHTGNGNTLSHQLMLSRFHKSIRPCRSLCIPGV